MPPKKKIAALVKVQLQAGAATPAPPVGTALGPHGVNIMEFCKAGRTRGRHLAVHQMISVGPCPQLAEREGEISFPIIRDMDTFCYERQHGADMEVGSYAHRAILHEPEDIPSIEQAKLSPTEMPFTSDDFDPQLEQAYELMPELLGAEGAEMRYAINGLLSLTCDGNPILGESLVRGLWTAAAVWIKEGPGVGRAV